MGPPIGREGRCWRGREGGTLDLGAKVPRGVMQPLEWGPVKSTWGGETPCRRGWGYAPLYTLRPQARAHVHTAAAFPSGLPCPNPSTSCWVAPPHPDSLGRLCWRWPPHGSAALSQTLGCVPGLPASPGHRLPLPAPSGTRAPGFQVSLTAIAPPQEPPGFPEQGSRLTGSPWSS